MELRHFALEALLCPDPDEKVAKVCSLSSFVATLLIANGDLTEATGLPGALPAAGWWRT